MYEELAGVIVAFSVIWVAEHWPGIEQLRTAALLWSASFLCRTGLLAPPAEAQRPVKKKISQLIQNLD
jgi:hypothetical protein